MNDNTSIQVTKKNQAELLAAHQPINRLLLQAAIDFGGRVYSYPQLNIFRAQYKGKKVFFRGQRHPLNTAVDADLVQDKSITNILLQEEDIRVPGQMVMSRAEYKKNGIKNLSLHYPLVVKPLDSTKGYGVITDINTASELTRYLKVGFSEFDTLLIEEFFGGMREYRITVLDNIVVAVLDRIPAHVVADGKHTIRQLIKSKNAERAQSIDIELGRISIDNELQQTLKNQNLSLASIPKKGKYIRLKNVCNMGAGGEVHDVTDRICKENRQLAVRIAKVFNLRLTGIDVICKDIHKPIATTGGVIIEVNSKPDIAMHHFPQQGKRRNIARLLIQAAFQ